MQPVLQEGLFVFYGADPENGPEQIRLLKMDEAMYWGNNNVTLQEGTTRDKIYLCNWRGRFLAGKRDYCSIARAVVEKPRAEYYDPEI